jgi:ABC-type multidrug transport system fused ATPase/permease subunit
MTSGQALHGFLAEDTVRDGQRGARSLRLLLSFAAPRKGRFFWSTALLLAAAALVALSAWLFGAFVEALRTGAERRLLAVGGCLIACELGSALFSYAGRMSLARTASLALLDVRAALFSHLHRLPLAWMDRQPLGRTVTRMTNDVEGMEDFFSSSMGSIVIHAFTAAAAGTGLFLTSPRLGGIALACSVPALALTWRIRGKAQMLNREVSRSNSAINAQLAEFLGGMPVIRSFALEDWSVARLAPLVERFRVWSLRFNMFNSLVRPTVALLSAAPLAFIAWQGAHEVRAGTLALGTLISLIRLSTRFSRPIDAISREIHTVQAAFTSTERVAVFLDAPTEIAELGADGFRECSNLAGEIEFRSVRMNYRPDLPVLRDVSFRIAPGSRIGLVGATGSGKSTTVSLLARLYEFQGGEILLDGSPLREFGRAALRRALGFVAQDTILFKGSVRQNIDVWGDRTEEEAREAARATGLMLALERSGRTLDSEVAERGADLSAGERQLIALTRVVLQQPAVLVLDEATSQVDSSYEERVHRVLDELMASKTRVIIAHRLSTVKQCDHLLVFKEGALVEQGRHQDLIMRGGYYAELVENGEMMASAATQ